MESMNIATLDIVAEEASKQARAMRISEPNDNAASNDKNCMAYQGCNMGNCSSGLKEGPEHNTALLSCEEVEADRMRGSGAGAGSNAFVQQRTTTLAQTVCSCSGCMASMTAYEP